MIDLHTKTNHYHGEFFSRIEYGRIPRKIQNVITYSLREEREREIEGFENFVTVTRILGVDGELEMFIFFFF